MTLVRASAMILVFRVRVLESTRDLGDRGTGSSDKAGNPWCLGSGDSWQVTGARPKSASDHSLHARQPRPNEVDVPRACYGDRAAPTGPRTSHME